MNFGKKDQRPIRHATLREMKRYLAGDHFKPESMEPKIEAMVQFLEDGGKKAIVTSPENLLKSIKEECGRQLIFNQ